MTAPLALNDVGQGVTRVIVHCVGVAITPFFSRLVAVEYRNEKWVVLYGFSFGGHLEQWIESQVAHDTERDAIAEMIEALREAVADASASAQALRISGGCL